MSAKHTPGPWFVTEAVRPAVVIGDVVVRLGIGGDEWRANARLIAAAPQMLDVLLSAQAMHQRYSDRVGAADWWARELKRDLDAAIAKALGEQQ